MLAALGEQGRIVADIAGHADTSTSMDIYARVSSESKKQAIDKLGDALWGKPKRGSGGHSGSQTPLESVKKGLF